MTNIKYTFSDGDIHINLGEDYLDDKVFYIINNQTKILGKRPLSNKFTIPKDLIKDKSVYFQLYWKHKGELISTRTGAIVYSDSIDSEIYKAVISNKGYQKVKREGYASVDKKLIVKINNNISWTNSHRNFDFNLNALRFLSHYWGEYFRTYEVSVLNEILEIIKQYYKYINSDVSKSNGFLWNNMAVGIRSLHISMALHLKDFISKQSLTILKSLHLSHLNKLLEPQFFSLSNHGIWQMFGLRALIYVDQDRDKEALHYCESRFRELINHSFNKECINTENSPFYHQYMITLFSLIPNGFLPLDDGFEEVIIGAKEATPWLADNEGRFFQIGDTEGFSHNSLDVEALKGDFETLGKKYISQCFIDSGYFISKVYDEKKCEAEFIFYNTSGSLDHKHLDGNSFILYYNDLEIFSDAGKYSYDRNDLTRYFRSFSAHNTMYPASINIDENSLDLQDTKLLYVNSNQSGYYSLLSKVSYPDFFNHSREVHYYPGKRVELRDTIKSYVKSDNILNFIFGPRVTLIDKSSQGYIIAQFNSKDVAKIILNAGAKSCEIYYGMISPYRGWVSKSYSNKEPVYSLEVTYAKEIESVETVIELC